MGLWVLDVVFSPRSLLGEIITCDIGITPFRVSSLSCSSLLFGVIERFCRLVNKCRVRVNYGAGYSK